MINAAGNKVIKEQEANRAFEEIKGGIVAAYNNSRTFSTKQDTQNLVSFMDNILLHFCDTTLRIYHNMSIADFMKVLRNSKSAIDFKNSMKVIENHIKSSNQKSQTVGVVTDEEIAELKSEIEEYAELEDIDLLAYLLEHKKPVHKGVYVYSHVNYKGGYTC